MQDLTGGARSVKPTCKHLRFTFDNNTKYFYLALVLLIISYLQ